MRTRDEALFNFASYILGRVISLVVFGLTVPLALKSFGSERYAVFSTLVLVLGFVPLLDAGVSYSLTYRYSRLIQRGVQHPARLISEHMRAYLGLAMAFALLFFFLFPWLFQTHGSQLNDIYIVATWGSSAAFFVCLSALGRATLVGQRKTHILNFADIGTDVMRGAAIYIGSVLLNDLAWTVFLTALTYAVRFLFLQLICARYTQSEPLVARRAIRIRSLRLSLSMGVPLAFSTAAIVAFGLFDKALIARQLSLADLTAYSLAYDIVVRGWTIVWAINGALTPIMMRWKHAKQSTNLSRAFIYSLAVAAFIVIAIYLPLNLFEHALVGWWLGDSMASTIQVHIALLSIASAFYIFADVFQNFFRANGQAILMAKAYLTAAVIYVPVLLFGLQNWQTVGAAVAQVVLWSATVTVMAYWYLKKFPSDTVNVLPP